jgi:hypothetical protein
MDNPTIPYSDTTQFRPTDVPTTILDDEDTLPPSTFTTTLSPSLLSDLKRFADEPGGTELLPVVAASVRHAKPLALHLQHGRSVLRLSVFPRDQLFHCPVNLCTLSHAELARLRLIHVEPEGTLAPFAPDGSRCSALAFGALAPLLWLFALHGARSELLPEIAGTVRYRLAPGVAGRGLPIDKSDMPLLQHLQRSASSLDELAGWTVLDPARVRRILNALYLQSGLIISRAFTPPSPSALPARPLN